MDKYNNCRVCGFDFEEPTWGENDNSPNYALICLCCGAHVGVDDETLEQVIEYRRQWLDNGAQWRRHRYKPDNWNLNEQLEDIPDKYL
jgi:transcription elongation factor Elf1